jgi:hypothetical protein
MAVVGLAASRRLEPLFAVHADRFPEVNCPPLAVRMFARNRTDGDLQLLQRGLERRSAGELVCGGIASWPSLDGSCTSEDTASYLHAYDMTCAPL